MENLKKYLLSFIRFYIKNFFVFLIVGIYIAIELSIIEWGLPGFSHPFPYHMDEWHQLEFVKNVFTLGTVDKSGSTQIPMFHFIVSGILISPFYLTHYIHPSDITSSVAALSEQHKLFVILRLSTLLFGSLSIVAITLCGFRFFKTKKEIPALLLVVTPIWLSLSNYFKYDIALFFWITTSIYVLLRLQAKSRYKDYALAGIIVAFSIGTKISAGPLLLLIPVANLLFDKRFSFQKVAIGFLSFGLAFVLLGVPDIFFRLNYYLNFTAQITTDLSKAHEGLVLSYPLFIYIFTKQLPTTFGYPFYLLFVSSLLFQTIKIVKVALSSKKQNKGTVLLLVGTFLFILTLAPLKLELGTNRILVLLPFLVLISSQTLKEIFEKYSPKISVWAILCFLLFIQFIQSMTWITMRYSPSVQKSSSLFLESNYTSQTIGIEGIPIYQLLPDIAIKNYYYEVYKIKNTNTLRFQVLNAKTKALPKIVVVTNDVIFSNYKAKNDKKDLLDRLSKEGYKKKQSFYPNLTLYKYFGNGVDFYLSGLLAEPFSTSIFEK